MLVALSGLVVEWHESRRGASPMLGFITVMINNTLFSVAVALTGGSGSPFLTLVAVPVAVMASRYCFRAVAIVVAATLIMTSLAGLAASVWGSRVEYPNVVTELSFLATFIGVTIVVFTFQSADITSRQTANTDALTGLPSRRALLGALERIEGTAAAAFLMFDVDHFKQINDKHGHERGDDVLRGIAAALRAATRPQDQIFRYGGEEFTVLLHDATAAGAVVAAERIRRAVADRRIADTPVTISVGVATESGSVNSTELLVRADTAMYAAKRAGRDRVIAWSGDLTEHPGTALV